MMVWSSTAVLPSTGPLQDHQRRPSWELQKTAATGAASYPLCTHTVRRKDRERGEEVLLRLGRGSHCFGDRRKTTAPSSLSETILPWPSLCKMELESLAEHWELAGAITQPIHHHRSLVSNKQVINALSVCLSLACVPAHRGRLRAAAADEETSPCLISR